MAATQRSVSSLHLEPCGRPVSACRQRHAAKVRDPYICVVPKQNVIRVAEFLRGHWSVSGQRVGPVVQARRANDAAAHVHGDAGLWQRGGCEPACKA
eukprot:3162609-Prymnesium_polylepis.2